jgi:hypothetical protein
VPAVTSGDGELQRALECDDEEDGPCREAVGAFPSEGEALPFTEVLDEVRCLCSSQDRRAPTILGQILGTG